MTAPSSTSGKLVSVVIPFYNRTHSLARAIESVIAQSWPDWEIVLVDDGSTDDSFGIASRYATAHPQRIRVFRQGNGGPGAARNAGIREVRGEFVGILDSDDQWNPDVIARVMAAYDAAPMADWIYFNVQRLDEQKRVIVASVFDDERAGAFRSLRTIRIGELALIEDRKFLRTAIAATIKEGANSIIRRRVLEKVAYPPIRVGEDRVLHISAIAAGFRFGYIDDVLMTKFHHAGNISVFDARKFDKALAANADLIQGLRIVRQSVPLDAEERAALRARLSNFYFERAGIQRDAGAGGTRVMGSLVKSFVTDPVHSPVLRAIVRRFGGS